MESGWRRPLFDMFAFAAFIALLVIIPSEFYLVGATPSFWILVAILLIVINPLGLILVMRRRMADIWHSEWRLFTALLPEAATLIESTLSTAGSMPKRRVRNTYRVWMTFDVGSNINITLVPRSDGVVTWVGPATKDNRKDIDHIEHLIEAALAPGK